jgi:hypothetical protein
MTEGARLLMIQFLEWIGDRPRSYADVLDAWRSSCPRHPVWEDALIEELVAYEKDNARTLRLTQKGEALLRREAQARMPTPAIRRSASARRGHRSLS